jgi:hypothetical protein
MAVTKQVYTIANGWSATQLADNLFRQAFIDAGLMTDWFDSFELSGRQWRVLEVAHDSTKTYGKTFYYFVFDTAGQCGVSIASGWDTATRTPTGTEFIDYHRLVSQFASASVSNDQSQTAITFVFNPVNSSQAVLTRYTSGQDVKQTWFTLEQGVSVSRPFCFLHPNTVLHPWLDLDKGIISGFSNILSQVSSNLGKVSFLQQENIRRALIHGTALRGNTAVNGNTVFHRIEVPSYSYCGIGSNTNQESSNLSSLKGNTLNGAVALPVGRASTNPSYVSDYIPICTGLPWSPFTPTLLASDFGIYMHYAANNIQFQDRFVVSAGVEEWEVLARANNAVAVDGASATFLARVV